MHISHQLCKLVCILIPGVTVYETWTQVNKRTTPQIQDKVGEQGRLWERINTTHILVYRQLIPLITAKQQRFSLLTLSFINNLKLFHSRYGIATPKGSQWRDPISLAILELQVQTISFLNEINQFTFFKEKGTIQMLYNKWWKNTGDVCTRQVGHFFN